MFELSFKVEPCPPISQIPWFTNRAVPEHWPRVTDGDDLVFPVCDELPHLRNHPFWGEGRTRVKLSSSLFTRGQDFDVGSTNIDDQDIHGFSLLGSPPERGAFGFQYRQQFLPRL